MAQITLKVNGKTRKLDADPAMPLLYALRDDLELHGPRFGCGLGQCGACTVIMEGNAIRSCSTPVSQAANKEITPREGRARWPSRTLCRPRLSKSRRRNAAIA